MVERPIAVNPADVVIQDVLGRVEQLIEQLRIIRGIEMK